LNPEAGYANETCFYLAEYNSRCKLKEMGYTEDLETLDALTGEMFTLIQDEVSRLREEQQQKQAKRGR
jgi:hypothetical protein